MGWGELVSMLASVDVAATDRVHTTVYSHFFRYCRCVRERCARGCCFEAKVAHFQISLLRWQSDRKITDTDNQKMTLANNGLEMESAYVNSTEVPQSPF